MPSAENRKIDERVWPILRELVDGQFAAAQARLVELMAEEEFRLCHARSQQIARVEQEFVRRTGREPWPADFTSAERIFWRGKLGAILSGWPLAAAIRDLQATAGPRRNLLYYLCAEKGKRAGRWEMLLCASRDAQWQAEKQAEARAAAEFFGEEKNAGRVTDPPRRADARRGGAEAEPEWVRRLQAERAVLQTQVDGPDGWQIRERLRVIELALQTARTKAAAPEEKAES